MPPFFCARPPSDSGQPRRRALADTGIFDNEGEDQIDLVFANWDEGGFGDNDWGFLTEPQRGRRVPFVIRNADRFFAGLSTSRGYQDANGISQCALLPLEWENDQDWIPGQGRRRNTPNWRQGSQVTYGMNLARGTVLEAGWVNGRYTNKPPGTPNGNHVVVFDRWDTNDRGQRGMWVAEQLADNRGPHYNFKVFGEGNYAWNAAGFSVVELYSNDDPLKIDNNLRRTLGGTTESCFDTEGL